MGKSKSKRYFNGYRSRSRSPDQHRTTPSSTQQWNLPTSSRRDNKSVEHAKKAAIDEKVLANQYFSVEDQLKRANEISEINYNPFVPKSFISNREKATSRERDLVKSLVPLSDIPLPKDENDKQKDPRNLIDSSLYVGTIQDRKEIWRNNLMSLRKKI